MLKLRSEMDPDVETHWIRHSVCSVVITYRILATQTVLGQKGPKTSAGYAQTESPNDIIFKIDFEEDEGEVIEMDYQI